MSRHPYPVRVDARLDPDLSRWLWLVKWIIVIPHVLVLVLWWLVLLVLTVVAFVAIVITGRYPRPLFDLNLGILRWTWRVAYYTHGGFGTDRYPPFSLAEHPEYPAVLAVDYPQRLSRGLVLVKAWLLAFPHLVVVGFLLGGFSAAPGADSVPWWPGGLIGTLTLFAAVVLLVRGSYPRGMFDLVVGLDRWVLRVAAYTLLMTDDYPPFRLDQGGPDPARPAPVPPPRPGPVVAGAPPASPRPMGAGRIVALVASSLAILAGLAGLSLAAAAAGGTYARDRDGFLSPGSTELTAPGYALQSEPLEIYHGSQGRDLPRRLLGTLRLEASSEGDESVFIGLGRRAAVEDYLSGVARSTVGDGDGDGDWPSLDAVDGGAPAVPPTDVDIWTAQAHGPGTQQITWEPEGGEWTVVVMNATGEREVEARVSVGATIPVLDDVARVAAVIGAILLLGGAVGLWLSLRQPATGRTLDP